ncbi:hypothetical protein HDU99_009512 [Rhizoclosmatium hyalinum]|nr:hypothetical protein HDU99_009512 [Rhizoclosmatium hyalinum]
MSSESLQLIDGDTSTIQGSEVLYDEPEHLPNKLKFTQQGATINVTGATSGAPYFSINFIASAFGEWFLQPTGALLSSPPTLPIFSEAAPQIIATSVSSDQLVASLNPYKHDIRRYGFKVETPTSSLIETNFPLDEGKNVYALGLFSTPRGKYQWLVNEFVGGSTQEPMNPKNEIVQFKLYFTKAIKHAEATTEAGKFLNSLFSGNTLGAGIARKVVATFTSSKSSSGLEGVLHHQKEWADNEEAALVATTALAAFIAYKYRVQRYQHKKLKGEFY